MTIIYHTNFDQRSGAWDKIRCGKLTCSKIADILTPAKLEISSSAKGLALKLAAERIKGCAEESASSFDIERGEQLEPEARYQYHTHYSPVEEVAFIENTQVPFPFGYSPDGLILDRRAAIEIKCHRAKGHMHVLLEGKIDGGYILQMQGGMLAGELEFVDYVPYHEGLILKPIRISRNDEIIAKIIEAGKSLEQMIQDIIGKYNDLKRSGIEIPLPEEIAL